MCTVSFVNSNGNIIITSNRDEKTVRPSAVAPKNYLRKGKNLIFPKDAKAGGTWFAVDSEGTVLVLLNGASEKHDVKLPYRKSRGLVVLDIISDKSPIDYWNEFNLENIEPFTLVLYQNKTLFQLRWNGIKKESQVLDVTQNHIWSSCTLYSEEIRNERVSWFQDFIKINPVISSLKMLDFHQNTKNKNLENGLVINRYNELKTLSVTQAILEKNKVTIDYHDLTTNENFINSFIII